MNKKVRVSFRINFNSAVCSYFSTQLSFLEVSSSGFYRALVFVFAHVLHKVPIYKNQARGLVYLYTPYLPYTLSTGANTSKAKNKALLYTIQNYTV